MVDQFGFFKLYLEQFFGIINKCYSLVNIVLFIYDAFKSRQVLTTKTDEAQLLSIPDFTKPTA